MPRSTRALSAFLVIGCTVAPGLRAAEPTAAELDGRFERSVKPFLATYCVGCHGGKSPAAQFDVRPYTSREAVVRDYAHWDLVLGRVSAKEMPPKALKQPSDAERSQFIDWIRAVRTIEAKRNAGDPGLVLARRLSNSEYNYTIRDLTGVDLKPTREFPVDPANPAGFDNSGESLTMSPALLNKYLQAAREVANNMVLTPDGFDFAPHPMLVETDREKYAIQRIVNFYESQPTDYAAYFEAAWRYKHRAKLGKPNATLASLAKEAQISAKYLPMVWGILGETPDPAPEAGPIAKLRTMWRALPEPGTAKPEKLKAQCAEMRDFVVRIRKHTARQFASPVVEGLAPASQPLLNWKLRKFAAHRRDWDRNALRADTDPPPVVPEIPKYPGLGQEAAPRAAALMARDRAGDNDLVYPKADREKWEAAFTRFSDVFPDVFYIRERGRFFPDDSEDKGRLLSAGFHNVMGYFRDDTPLMELILDEQGQKHLDRLWQEFEFIADFTTRTWVQYFFNQSGEVAGRGRESGSERPSDKAVAAEPVVMGLRDAYIAKASLRPYPEALDAIRDHFTRVNNTLRSVERMRAEAEPLHVGALLKFAARAWRRPLSTEEQSSLRAFYSTLREKNSLTHEEAIRDSVVSILLSPKFSYRLDFSSAAPGPKGRAPLSSYELASRLSYFLWSSMPDDKLMQLAAGDRLKNPAVLAAEARRMLKDQRARALAVEFAGNWLGYRRFEEHNAVDRGRFPAFDNDLRQAMFEEPVRLIDDAIRNNRSVLDLLYGKHTFVNPVLAKHYGIEGVTGSNDNWVRLDDASKAGRGGLLPMSVFLTINAPGLRTSPVKRGYWVARSVLGEQIPPPPPNVPELPDDEEKMNLPLREMLAKHRENPACASCHARFDSFGLVFEGYGPVGERRTKDLAGRAVDTNAEFPGGATGSGYEDILGYIRQNRQKDFTDNLSRKLLAYALGRSLQLSDEPLIEQMSQRLAAGGYRFASLIETIVTSTQFVNKRAASEPRQQLAAGPRPGKEIR